jgi:hypothetical protein
MMETASALAPPSGGSLSSVTSGILAAGQQLCHNLYLQSKQPMAYHQIEVLPLLSFINQNVRRLCYK